MRRFAWLDAANWEMTAEGFERWQRETVAYRLEWIYEDDFPEPWKAFCTADNVVGGRDCKGKGRVYGYKVRDGRNLYRATPLSAWYGDQRPDGTPEELLGAIEHLCRDWDMGTFHSAGSLGGAVARRLYQGERIYRPVQSVWHWVKQHLIGGRALIYGAVQRPISVIECDMNDAHSQIAGSTVLPAGKESCDYGPALLRYPCWIACCTVEILAEGKVPFLSYKDPQGTRQWLFGPQTVETVMSSVTYNACTAAGYTVTLGAGIGWQQTCDFGPVSAFFRSERAAAKNAGNTLRAKLIKQVEVATWGRFGMDLDEWRVEGVGDNVGECELVELQGHPDLRLVNEGPKGLRKDDRLVHILAFILDGVNAHVGLVAETMHRCGYELQDVNFDAVFVRCRGEPAPLEAQLRDFLKLWGLDWKTASWSNMTFLNPRAYGDPSGKMVAPGIPKRLQPSLYGLPVCAAANAS